MVKVADVARKLMKYQKDPGFAPLPRTSQLKNKHDSLMGPDIPKMSALTKQDKIRLEHFPSSDVDRY